MGGLLKLYLRFKDYLVVGLLIIAVVSTVGWYIRGIRLESAEAKAETAAVQLSVSNQSIVSMKGEFDKITKLLTDSALAEAAKQEKITDELNAIREINKSRIVFENALRNRKSITDCPLPKDLQDAWNRL